MERAVVGKREALELVLLGFLADGHVLIEDFPGLAKTLIARSFAQVSAMRFRARPVHARPDAFRTSPARRSSTSERATSSSGRARSSRNLLLGDEINRAPPKTQAALLEAMQERQVTIEGRRNLLERPFLVIATQNPIEYEGHLPAARGAARPIHSPDRRGYPSQGRRVGATSNDGSSAGPDEVSLAAGADRNGLLEMQASIEQVHVSSRSALTSWTSFPRRRTSQRVQVGASPRGSLAILKLSRQGCARLVGIS